MFIYFFIFFAKMVEVSMAITRIVVITRGAKFLGAIIGFFEVILWVVLITTVLTNVTEDPVKVVFYALGFSAGNLLGSMFEQFLGIGSVRVEVIVTEHQGDELVQQIRDEGYGVTVIDAKGMDSDRQVLLMNIKRKNHGKVIDMIKAYQENIVITINDVKPVYGGYGLLKK